MAKKKSKTYLKNLQELKNLRSNKSKYIEKINVLDKLPITKLIPYKEKKRRPSTIVNIHLQTINSLNSKIERLIEKLSLKGYKSKSGDLRIKPKQKKGLIYSIKYFAWEEKDLIQFLKDEISKKQKKNMLKYVQLIRSVRISLQQYQLMQGLYDHIADVFEVFKLKLN